MAESEKEMTTKTKHDFIWDDKLLIRAYDESLNLGKEELAMRLAAAKNKKPSDDLLVDSESSSSTEEESDAQIDPDNPVYVVGSYVRAHYIDGVDYEAEIMSIDQSTGLCHIKYIGYGNEEDVLLNDLVPSWGKKVRRKQIQVALKENASTTETTVNKTKQQKKTKRNTQTFFQSNLYSSAVPPPTIPPIPSVLLESGEDDAEHLSDMLMSWYISGYYTGVYQGVRMTKEKLKKK